MIRTHPLLASALVIGFALFVFWRVRIAYATRGKLPPVTLVLQFLVFFLHALAYYSFVDSRVSGASRGSLQWLAGWGLMLIGLVSTLASMGRLSWSDTIGRSVTGLRQSGVYGFTRNPQLLAYLAFLSGYVLLRPSWLGLAWLGLYGFVAHLMVLTEEQHLRRVFGTEYRTYCQRTPRFLGVPKRP